ncbi:MLO-like protein 10 [Dendrobium catenatum]|uniref:MLO-like protein n=1 Tax=Dendrobium catenatum TaxID=906689 RepID=A0A2I0WB06_9ASPA|nr:MLO-like protein 10 [Dendrobium catenatum]
MAGGGGEGARDLDQTPTWAVASVCAVIIVISIFLEKILHLLDKHKKALNEALEKVKSELMVLGFISLLLTFGQNYIAKICIPESVADTMLPCRLVETNEDDKEHRRRLLWSSTGEPLSTHRSLAEASVNSCPNMRRWKEWEKETRSIDYEFSNDPSRFRLVHDTSFVKQHTSFWEKHPILLYFVCFFHQFFRSVTKADYLTLRHGFINVHLAPGSNFNFQKYIKRSLEDDFKVVVGISPLLWASAVIFLLLNVHGWEELFWVSLLPPIILLAVGTKLQAIIAKMAIQIKDRHAVVQGIPLVQLKEVGEKNPCEKVIVQFMCSYITLPLYALVSQMGSDMKRSIFDEQTNRALKKWHQAVRKRHKKGNSPSPTITPGSTPRTSPTSSPNHLLHRYKTTGHSDMMQTRYYLDQENERSEMIETAPYFSDRDNSETENGYTTMMHMIPSFKHSAADANTAELRLHVEEERNEEFTFDKPTTESEH